MSLNGLDDVKVKEAHDAAIAELGGWFLLKYVLRDEVDLFERGNGGIVEVRSAIAQYEEESPLFGFLRYRRRNVLIKYVPEGCSRLIQARVTVHFTAFSEKFSPHDTVFPIASSKDLKDSTLSAACSLHTASGSTSSSTSSLRKRRLVEIAEDENEDKRQSIVVEDQVGTVNGPSMAGTQAQFSAAKSTMNLPDIGSPASHHSAASDAAALSPLEASDNRPASPTKSLDGRRRSSQSTRPAMYSYSSFGSNGRPKVKLGPRPSLDIGGRPQTSASSASYRPVSTLPPGLKLFSKNSKGSKDGAQSHNRNPPPTMTISPPPLQSSDLAHQPSMTLTRPHTSGGRPKTSSGSSVKSAITPTTTTPKSPMMTPEKMRLMRAMQLRKKQMEASSAQNIPEAPPVPEIRLPQDSPNEAEDTYRNSNEMERTDSAIAIEAPSEVKMAASDKTIMSSTPASPTETSDEGPSTQPSSVSDSLHETLQEVNNKSRTNEPDHLKLAQPTAQESQRISPRGDCVGVVEGHTSGAVQNKSAESQSSNVPSKDKQEATIAQGIKNDPEAPEGLPNSSAETNLDVEQNRGETLVKTDLLASKLARIGSENTADASAIPISSSEDSSHPEASISTIPEKLQASIVMQSTEMAETPASPVRQLKIPRSKYSTQPLEKDNTKSSTQVQAQSSIGRPSRNNRSVSPTSSTCSSETRRSVTDADQHGAERQGRKKRRVVEPIRTDLSTERSGHNSEAELLSDDDLMDELQSATVQEAQPISVSKSPISPTFTHDSKRFSRAFSNPFASKNKMLSPHDPLPEQSRSVSASYLNRLNQQQTLPIVKKVNLGSGISQRIKALEKATTAPAVTPGMTSSTSGSSPSFFMARQPSRAGSKSPSIVARGESLTRNKDSPLASREGSPETIKLRERSESMQSRFEKFDSPPPTQSHKSRPESISVTARIIRDPSQPFPQKPDLGRDPFEYSPLELQQSPLVIDHQKAIIGPAPTQKDSLLERRLSNPKKDGKEKRRSSISMVKDLITERRSSIVERRKSMTIEPPTPSTARSSSRPPSTHGNSERTGRPLSISSRVSTSSRDQSASMSQNVSSPTGSDDNAEKKSGRTSRMFRKMSATLSSSRKSLANAISPTVREEFEPPPSFPASQPSPYPSTPSVEVGDVNVQFPDNLLWKRRSMSFDSKGFLILSPAQSNKAMEKSISTKRYHLSEFRTPFIPEMEVQELPNSVVLDFIDGGGLQVACEDRGGQNRVLQILLEAYRTHGAFGQ